MPKTGNYIYKGADLFYICPRCGTRNHPNADICSGCGGDIGRDLRSLLIEQAQDTAWRAANRKKTLRNILITLAIATVFFAFIADWLVRGSLIDPKRMQEAANLAVQYGVKVSPYKWVSADGNAALLLIPEFTNGKQELDFTTLLFNQTGKQCILLNQNIYAVDDQGVVHDTDHPWLIQDDLVPVPNGKTSMVETKLYPTLTPDVKALTIVYPEYCGQTTGSVEVDLSGENVVVK